MNKLKWIFSQPAGQQLAAAFGIAVIFLVSVIGGIVYNWKADTKVHQKYEALLTDSLVNCSKNMAKHDEELSRILLNFLMNQNKNVDKIQSGLDSITSNSKKITQIIKNK
jgi:hypothetical protein